jgi:hypothetical protein
MIREKRNTGNAAVAFAALGTAIMVIGCWLMAANIAMNAVGLLSAFVPGVDVMWDGLFPITVGLPATNPFLSEPAGFVIGLLISLVQILVWNNYLDWKNMGLFGRTVFVSASLFDVVTCVWVFTGGTPIDPAHLDASIMRLLMSLALTFFAFSVGSERWVVLGFRLASLNMREALIHLGYRPENKKDRPEHFADVRVQHDEPKRHDRPSEQERREQSERDRAMSAMMRQRKQAEQVNQQQHSRQKGFRP